MTESALPIRPTAATTIERMFPTLSAAQISRIAAHGCLRQTRTDEILIEPGAQAKSWFLVTKGRIEILPPSNDGSVVVAIPNPGQFTGEVSMLSGRHSLVRMRVSRPGEAIELDRGRY